MISRNILKYKKLYIVFFAILLWISFKFFMNEKQLERDENFTGKYYDVIIDAYNINSDILNFDENNKAILNIEVLYVGVSNGVDHISLGIIPHNDYQDACVGYFIITKRGELLEIDSSHICDLIDF